MASACVNNIGTSPENNFLDCTSAPCHSYGWLSPRISFSRDFADDSPSMNAGTKPKLGGLVVKQTDESEIRDPDSDISVVSEFEFRLEDPVTMLPADELFSDGKLMPLHLSSVKSSVSELKSTTCESMETSKSRRMAEVCGTDPYLFSPKAPRCSSRWRELLGLKKLHQNSSAKNENNKTPSSCFSDANSKALKYFLHRSSKSSLSSSFDASLSLPLLKDSDCESVSVSSSRVSLSSSSSGHEYEELHRLSLDCDRPNSSYPPTNPISLHRNPNPTGNNLPRMRMVKPRPKSSENNPRSTVDHSRAGRSSMRRSAGECSGVGIRGVSVDSPRMNSSGKIVFHNLERSSSSPSSFNGGPKFKNRGMERSYSANVRVTPVLNVPVCSLRGSSKSVSVFGFGQLFSSPQKRDNTGGVNGGGSGRTHQSNNNRTRIDRSNLN